MEFYEIYDGVKITCSPPISDALTCVEAVLYLNDFALTPPSDKTMLNKLKTAFNMDKNKLDEFDEDAWFEEITGTEFEEPIMSIDKIFNLI